MCLAVPGEIISDTGEGVYRLGQVRFGEAVLEINLAFVPEAKQGDYVLVHAGIAIGVLNPDRAKRTLASLDNLIYSQDTQGSSFSCSSKDLLFSKDSQ